MTAPPSSADICSATLVINDSIDIRRACTHSTRCGQMPLARAISDGVALQGEDHVGAQQPAPHRPEADARARAPG